MEEATEVLSITQQEIKTFSELFQKYDLDRDGFLTGTESREILSQSGLANIDLATIWSLSDMNKDKKLDQWEFTVAMTLINWKRQGKALPNTLPDNLKSPLYSSSQNAGVPTLSTSSEIKGQQSVAKGAPFLLDLFVPSDSQQKFQSLFRATVNTGEKFLAGTKARDIFVRSKLGNEDLSKIW
jgi:epidermal growth factor receptor substrate 15